MGWGCYNNSIVESNAEHMWAFPSNSTITSLQILWNTQPLKAGRQMIRTSWRAHLTRYIWLKSHDVVAFSPIWSSPPRDHIVMRLDAEITTNLSSQGSYCNRFDANNHLTKWTKLTNHLSCPSNFLFTSTFKRGVWNRSGKEKAEEKVAWGRDEEYV